MYWTGHSGIVRYLENQNLFSEIWILPVYQHMFVAKKGLIPFEHRMAMCKLCMEVSISLYWSYLFTHLLKAYKFINACTYIYLLQYAIHKLKYIHYLHTCIHTYTYTHIHTYLYLYFIYFVSQPVLPRNRLGMYYLL